MQAQAKNAALPADVSKPLTPAEFARAEAVLDANRKINLARKVLKDFDERVDARRKMLLRALEQARREFKEITGGEVQS